MTEQELVKWCLAQVCERAGLDASQRLTQRDLEFLCDTIEEKTNVLISLSTMKRLINGQFTRMPQVATLNAISHYLGYDNWQHFKQQQKQEAPAEPTFEPAPTPVISPRRRRPVRYKIIGAAAVVLLVVVILASRTLSGHSVGNYDKASFSARKTTSNDLPNTVVFNYNIDQLQGDSFFIQQSWDWTRRVRIHKNAYTLTDIYYEPGYHKAKLIVNDSVIKTVDVSIPTKGWCLYTKAVKPDSHPVYIRKEQPASKGIMGITKEDLAKYQVNTAEEHHYCYTWFPGTQTVSSDNFILKARARVINMSNPVCPRIMVEVYTRQSFIFFRASPTGCTSNIDAMFGEQYLSGKTNDLSNLGCDISQWQDYEMEVRNRKATVRINGKDVLTRQYQKGMDLIAGMGFVSNGLIEVDAVELKGLDGTVLFSDQFDR